MFELSRGGMGRVELAVLEGPRFRRFYAVKRLHPHHAEDAGVREMFLEEGRLAGLIRHPHVVSVLDVGEDADGPFLVMDFVDGVPLSSLVSHAHKTGEPLPIALCARLVRDAARGLHAAHELRDTGGKSLGLVHRDVSPQNILVGFDGLARVTDFGVAKALDSGNRTSTGLLKGKMGYMAPERLRFEAPDRRSDLFSLGVVFFELVAGERLYQGGDGTEIARRILNEPPPDIGLAREDVPAAVTELLFELLAKEPELRPASAAAVAERLDVVVEALNADEGMFDVGAWLLARFGDERVARERRVTESMAQGLVPLGRSRRRVLAALAGVPLLAGAAWIGAKAFRTDVAAPPAPPIASGKPAELPAPQTVSTVTPTPPQEAPAPAPASDDVRARTTPKKRTSATRPKAKPAPKPPGQGVRHWEWK